MDTEKVNVCVCVYAHKWECQRVRVCVCVSHSTIAYAVWGHYDPHPPATPTSPPNATATAALF